MRVERGTTDDLQNTADALDSFASVLTAVPGANVVLGVFGGILHAVSFIIRLISGTLPDQQSEAERLLKEKFDKIMNELQKIEVKQDEIQQILEWSYYKNRYAGYIAKIEVLYSTTQAFVTDPQSEIRKNELKTKISGDTSVEEFYNFVVKDYIVQDNVKLLEAAFDYFDHDLKKTQLFMADTVFWLIKGMMVEMVLPLTYNYKDSLLKNHLEELEAEWLRRIAAVKKEVENVETAAKQHTARYIEEDVQNFFKINKEAIDIQQHTLEDMLNRKYDWLKCNVVMLEHDNLPGSCAYLLQDAYVCLDGEMDKGCPDDRNFVVFSQRSDTINNVCQNVSVGFTFKTSLKYEGKDPYEEYIVNRLFTNYTRFVFQKEREHHLTKSDCCLLQVEVELSAFDKVKYKARKLLYMVIVDMCGSLNTETVGEPRMICSMAYHHVAHVAMWFVALTTMGHFLLS